MDGVDGVSPFSAESSFGLFRSVTASGRSEDSRCRKNWYFINKIKQNNNKNYPEGQKQAGRPGQCTAQQGKVNIPYTQQILTDKNSETAQDCRHQENK